MKTSKYIESVYELCEEFIEYPEFVVINEEGVNAFADVIKGHEMVNFSLEDKMERRMLVLRELLASSINFCYWYGGPNSNKRKRGSSTMYRLLDEVIEKVQDQMLVDESFYHTIKMIIGEFSKRLMQERFTMLEERRKRLEHLSNEADEVAGFCIDVASGRIGLDDLFEELFAFAPEFADDMFLKRAFLFPLVLNRSGDFFVEDISMIPVPADYQIPKMLRSKHVLVYESALEHWIDDACTLPKGSLPEIEIRASTIVACREIAKRAGVTMQTIDDYLFSIRKTVHSNHHLTLTTDY